MPRRPTGRSALLWATYQSSPELVTLLLDARRRPESWRTVRRHAAAAVEPQRRRRDDARVARRRRGHLASGARRRDAADGGRPHRQHRCRQLLLEHGADPNAAEALENETALMWATAEGHLPIVDVLLRSRRGSEPQGARVRADEAQHARGFPDRRLHGADVGGARRRRSDGAPPGRRRAPTSSSRTATARRP